LETLMEISPFKLERYFAKYEFKVKYLLSPSDCESLSMHELLEMAEPDGLALWNNLRLGYTESPGHPALRTEIAQLYRTITAENVVVAAPEEAVMIGLQSMLKPGDRVVCISPAYQSLYEIPRSIGCDVVSWQLVLEKDGWRLDLDQLETLLTDATRLLVINFPHNPTGYLPSPHELDTMVALARKRGVYIFSDEMYRMLEYDPARRLPAMCDLYDKGISLSGLSKAFALPGLRLGWLAAQEPALIESWLGLKDYTTICNSAPSEILGIIALRAKETILARNLGIIRGNLRIAGEFFAARGDRFRWLAASRVSGFSAMEGQWSGRGVLSARGGSTRSDDRAGEYFRFSRQSLSDRTGTAEFRGGVGARWRATGRHWLKLAANQP
jgi:aspartate/methionine/tyrosine aminotransferase